MARIPAAELERLKSDISLVRLLESQGYQLQKAGKDYITRCPFHDDDTASLVISPSKNLFNCFGCGAGGSVIDWTMKIQGVSFRHAVELLQHDPSALVADKPVQRSRAQKLDTPFALNADDQKLLNDIIDYYHQTLKQNPEALAYCDKRGINREAIDHFKLGFANRSLGYRLPPKANKDGQAIRTQLQTIGLLRDSGHEHFNGSLVIPIIDQDNNVTEVYGRKIGERLRKGTPLHLYLPGPHKGIFNAPTLAANKEIILCESLIDALTLWSNGFTHVTTSYGTQGFTDEHLQAFKHHNIERVLIAYDRDDAGNNAADTLAKKLNQENIDCYRILFPKGMDANAYALAMQPPGKSLELVIRKAEWLGTGKPKHRQVPHTELLPNTNEKQQLIDELEQTKDDLSLVAREKQQSLPASPQPEQKAVDVNAAVQEHEINIPLEDRHYRIRGLQKNSSYEQLKINVLVMSKDGRYADAPGGSASASSGDHLHVDTFDLYNAKHRNSFIQQASIELGVHHDTIKADLGKVLLKLEALQDQQIKQTLEPKSVAVSLSNEDQHAALALLKSPDLLSTILKDFDACGIVGEHTNKLAGYLACISRKLDNPLAIIVQSTSAAGKSSLMDAVLNMMPEEDKVQYAAMTGQSLFYMGETDLKNKILAIVEEEGASQASYALKLLQSEGELTIASTGKDPTTGRLETQEYHVEGPVMLFLTTTAIDIDDELLNRCLVLTVNEEREQTQAIHQQQRKKRTLEGLLLKQQKNNLLNLHRNAQRLLKPLHVVNPYAEQLTFLDDKTRTRRDHEKYLTLIESIALLHQYQRDIKTIEHNNELIEYIEVALTDIETANQLAHELLGRTLDELPPQTRRLLKLINGMVKVQCQQEGIKQHDIRFSRRELRDITQWSDTALKVHLSRLVDLEYLLIHRSGRGQAYHYELLYNGQVDDQPFLNGLIDIKNLTSAAVPDAALPPASMQSHDAKRSGQNDSRSGVGQPPVSGQSGDGQTVKKPLKQNNNKHLKQDAVDNIDNNTTSLKINAS